MTNRYKYNKYFISNIYGAGNPDQNKRILEFWRQNNAVANQQEALQRVKQVVLIAEDENNQIVGLTTVYPNTFIVNMKPFLYYRMFIQPNDRVYGMMEYMTQMTHEALKNMDIPNKPDGMVIITENIKLMRKGMKRMLGRSGLEYIGINNSNQDVWYWGFDKPSFPNEEKITAGVKKKSP